MPILLVFPVSREMTTLVLLGCIVTSRVVLFLYTQSSHVLFNVVLFGEDVGSCLGVGTVSIRLAMILWPFRRMALV